MKPTPWEKDRGIFLKIGFAASLSIVLLAFNYTVEPEPEVTYAVETYPQGIIEVIPITRQDPETPPPPPAPPTRSERLIIEPSPDPVVLSKPEPIRLPQGSTNPNPLTVVAPPPPLPPPPVIQEPKEVPIFVEVMPRFPGCEGAGMNRADKEMCAQEELLRFLRDNIKYPRVARENNIEGMVVVNFIVEKDGSISNANIVRDIGGGCGKEAVRVINLMPDWTPGLQQGRKVRVQFNLPVRFSLGR